jgi:peptidyl-prolyl cis-trans isomerase SurA
MPDAFALTNRARRLAFAFAIALGVGLAVAAPSAARAQTVVVFVNGEPITSLDVDQRMKLIEISTRKVPPRQEALDELIDEKLKLQVGKKYGLEIADKDVDGSFGTMARNAGGQTAKQFAEALSKAGINVPALKRRIKADMTWSAIVRGKFPSINAVGDKDIRSALKPDQNDTASYIYTLREVVFILPRGAPPAAVEARKREADGLRHRFENCEQGVPFARALTDVVVREPIRRNAADIGQAQRDVLEQTAVGHLTPPEAAQEGVEMFAVCAKDTAGTETLGMAQTRQAMVTERYNAQAKRYLLQLRREAIIEPSR